MKVGATDIAVAVAAIFAIAISIIAKAPAADREKLLSAREVYDVSLERTSGYLLSARGRTVVETRAGCGATRTLQRSLADVTYKGGIPIRTDFVIATRESGEGHALKFDVSNTQTGNGTESHKGEAALNGTGGGQITFSSHDKPFSLPRGTMFPSAFSRAILEAARKGHGLANRPVYQGGGRDALVLASVKIGRRLSRPHEIARDSDRLLQGVEAWPILISYFAGKGELPASEVAAHLYANGLLGSLSLVYPQFTLRSKLVRVERLRSSC